MSTDPAWRRFLRPRHGSRSVRSSSPLSISNRPSVKHLSMNGRLIARVADRLGERRRLPQSWLRRVDPSAESSEQRYRLFLAQGMPLFGGELSPFRLFLDFVDGPNPRTRLARKRVFEFEGVAEPPPVHHASEAAFVGNEFSLAAVSEVDRASVAFVGVDLNDATDGLNPNADLFGCPSLPKLEGDELAGRTSKAAQVCNGLSSAGFLPPVSVIRSPALAWSSEPKAGAGCSSSARRDLYGGPGVTRVPTVLGRGEVRRHTWALGSVGQRWAALGNPGRQSG